MRTLMTMAGSMRGIPGLCVATYYELELEERRKSPDSSTPRKQSPEHPAMDAAFRNKQNVLHRSAARCRCRVEGF